MLTVGMAGGMAAVIKQPAFNFFILSIYLAQHTTMVQKTQAPILQLTQLSKVYDSMGGKVHALRDVSLSINAGENVVVVGKSGSGKSTLLNVMTGIDRPSSGDVVVNGQSLNALSENKLALWRGKQIGIVFQFYQLLPTLSVLDNVLFAMDVVNTIPKAMRRTRAQQLLASVWLDDKVKKFPNELSGGEKQRVAIARALANDPPILMADEPTGNLDSKTGDQVRSIFQSLHAAGKTIVTVTHERLEGRSFDKLITITDGCISIA